MSTILFITLIWSLRIDAMTNAVYSDAGEDASSYVYLDCDTILDIDGYSVHVINEGGDIKFIGLNLFQQGLRQSMDKEILESIESGLYRLTKPTAAESEYNPVKIIKGEITDFKNISADTPCSIDTYDSKGVYAEWTLPRKKVRVMMPISYDTAKRGTRSEIEDKFISRLKSSDSKLPDFPEINHDALIPYGDDQYMLPGESYQKRGVITRNVYLNAADASPVWDLNSPLESIANMFIYPSDIYPDINVELTILKHAYGEKETLTVPLRTLLGECSRDGCIPFWGVDKFENGELEGALFFLNKTQGYDHVIRVKCDVGEVFSGTGNIVSRGSLYIPTNNVDNLFAPYEETEPKKWESNER